MKSTQTLVKSAWWASVAFMFLFLFTSLTFSQDVPKLISYQGMLQKQGVNVQGEQVIRLTLYSDIEGQNIVWRGSYKVDVKDGIFSVLLGSGKYGLPEAKEMDKQLYLGIALQGEDEMRPLTKLASAPYALNIPDRSVTLDKLSNEVYGLLSKEPRDGERQTVPVEWMTNGNSLSIGSTGTGIRLGSTNAMNWELITHGVTVMRYQVSNASQQPDILGGWAGDPSNPTQYPGNSITSAGFGSNIIAGGGILTTAHTDGSPNKIYMANFSTISGGARNFIGDSTETDTVWGASIGGGGKNRVEGRYSTVAGGRYARLTGRYSAVGGGYHNEIVNGQNDWSGSAIPGGRYLRLGNNSFGFNGHYQNDRYVDLSGLSQIAAFNDVNLLIGNIDNTAREVRFYEPGTDTIFTNNNYTAFKAGAQANNITYTLPLTLPGTPKGSLLYLDNNAAQMAWLPPGANGKVLKMNGTTGLPEWGNDLTGTGGGAGGDTLYWYAESSAIPTNAPLATDTGAVAHGEKVLASGKYSSIGGGRNDTVTGIYSVIGGGIHNNVFTDKSVISGGQDNTIKKMDASTSHPYTPDSIISSIADWMSYFEYDTISMQYGIKSTHNTISGGLKNRIESDSNFGWGNIISGGGFNSIRGSGAFSVIGGGVGNQILETRCVIPGGEGLIAAHPFQTILGHYNIPKGFYSNYPPYGVAFPGVRPLFIIGNGGTNDGRSNAFEVSSDGHTTVFHENGTGAISPIIRGSTYTDNVIYAWGEVYPPSDTFFKHMTCPTCTGPQYHPQTIDIALFGGIVKDFGVSQITLKRVATFRWEYEVSLNIASDSLTLIDLTTGGASITATVVSEELDNSEDHETGVISVSRMKVGNKFKVWIRPWECTIAPALSCHPYPLPFMFKVTGRPN